MTRNNVSTWTLIIVNWLQIPEMAHDQCHSIPIHTIIAAPCLPKEALGLVTSHGSCGPCGHCAWSQDGGSGSSCSAGGTARAANRRAGSLAACSPAGGRAGPACGGLLGPGA